MYWINEGTYSKKELCEAFNDKNIYEVNLSKFNNGEGRDYPYWSSIRHPKTGKLLTATKGYMSSNDNTCYYAEYKDSDGNFYNYTRGSDGTSIMELQHKDEQTRIEEMKNSQEREKFSKIMSNDINKTNSNENVIEHLNNNEIKR